MTVLNYTEEHHSFRKKARAFFDKEIVPHIDQWEKDHIVPKSAWKKMGAAGLLCPTAAKEYGGMGGDFLYSVIANEELIRTNFTGLTAGLHSDIVVPYIESFGSEEQKKKYIPGCISGDVITAVAMTEPGAGSDVAAMEMTAVEEGDEIVLNGSKTFISNGIICDLVVVAAKDPAAENKHEAVSLFIVEDGTPGFTRGRHLEKMGMYSQDTAELFFSNCRIPKENRLGDKGAGFLMLMLKLQQERLVSAISTVSGAEYALERIVDYCKNTTVNGKPLCKHQAIKFELVEMAAEIKLNRAFLNNVIVGHASGQDVTADTMIIKYTSSEMVNKMVDRSLDLMGTYGAQEGNPMVRAFRDLRITTIFAGTTEIMKTIAAKSMGL